MMKSKNHNSKGKKRLKSGISFIKKSLILVSFLIIVAIIIPAGYLIYLSTFNGRAINYDGEVSVYNSKRGGWEYLKENYKLMEGDIVKTGEGSSVTFVAGKVAGVIVKVEENSEVKVASKNLSSLDLSEGKLMASLTRPSTREVKFTVKTPTGVCGVRGTGWSVESRDKNTDVEIFEGRVKFGETQDKYDKDPFIARDGQKLSVKKGDTVTYDYAKVENEKYYSWNKWMKDSSDRLSSRRIINKITGSRPDPYPAWQEGVCLASWEPAKYGAIETKLTLRKIEEETNASWINLVTTWYQLDAGSTDIHPLLEKTPSDDSLNTILKLAEKKGLHIMLTPQVDIESPTGDSWRADIAFSNDNDWTSWFESYKKFILHYASIAENNNVEMLNIGTELSQTAIKRPDKWIEIIKEIRKVYKGKLLYTANWFEEYKEIKFWNYLDYAGISSYFPVADDDNPSYAEMKSNWENWANEIEAWQKTHALPVIFPEIGYKSCRGSAKMPWAHDPTGPIDLKQQYNAYKAALSTFWGKEWFYGLYWWAWRTHPSIGGPGNRGFTPNGKPAAKLVRKWYLKPDPHKYKSQFNFI